MIKGYLIGYGAWSGAIKVVKQAQFMTNAMSKATDNNLSAVAVLNETAPPSITVNILDRIGIASFVLDKDHHIIHWNSAMEALSGLSREDMVGTKNQWRPFYASPRPCMADLIPEGGRNEDVEKYYMNKFSKSALIREAYEAEDYFPDCGENGEWLHFIAANITNENGEVIGAIETLMNISSRKKAEFKLQESEKMYKELSITDGLTKLYNSRHFYAELNKFIENAQRYKHPFALCFFDLDDFKKLNDNYGHLTGDSVLETFSSFLRSSLRTGDSGYRYGGEEFAILLPSADIEGATVVAERVRKTLNEYSFTLPNDAQFKTSVSAGVTEFKTGDSVESIMNRADRALYNAKSNGKNCVVTD